MRQENLEYLFNNLKNGDFLAFYKKPWLFLFARLIFLVTGVKVSHIAGIFDVKRDENCVSFRLGEQLVSKGKVTKKYVINKALGDYIIDSRFRDKTNEFYYLENRYTLSEEQNDDLRSYWECKEDYSLAELPFTQNWFYKLFGNKNKVYDNNCSTAARQSMINIGIRDMKLDDPVPNPKEFIQFDYIKSMIKIKWAS